MFCHKPELATNGWGPLWGKDIIQDTYDQDHNSFILEFLDLALRTEQVLDQMRQRVNVQLHPNPKR